MPSNRFAELGKLGGQARAKRLGKARRSAIASKAANARWRGLRGIVDEGEVPAARFIVGLKVDAPTEETLDYDPKGFINQKTGINELFRLRAEQVGAGGAAGTIRRCQGMFEGAAQSTIECEIASFQVPGEETKAVWEEHMLDLGERVAGRFGQKEVWIWFGPRLVRASARGRPAPESPHGKVLR